MNISSLYLLVYPSPLRTVSFSLGVHFSHWLAHTRGINFLVSFSCGVSAVLWKKDVTMCVGIEPENLWRLFSSASHGSSVAFTQERFPELSIFYVRCNFDTHCLRPTGPMTVFATCRSGCRFPVSFVTFLKFCATLCAGLLYNSEP